MKTRSRLGVMDSPAASLCSPSRAAVRGEVQSPPRMASLEEGGSARDSAASWHSLLIGRTAEEIQDYQSQVAEFCRAKGITCIAATYQQVEAKGSRRVMVSRWTSSTLAAIRSAGTTPAMIAPRHDQQSAPTPVKGEGTHTCLQ